MEDFVGKRRYQKGALLFFIFYMGLGKGADQSAFYQAFLNVQPRREFLYRMFLKTKGRWNNPILKKNF